jgi:hypothetical protein
MSERTPDSQRPEQMTSPTRQVMATLGALDTMLARTDQIRPALTLPPDAEETLWALTQLRVATKGFCERAGVGLIEPIHWQRMADLLRQAATVCDEQNISEET